MYCCVSTCEGIWSTAIQKKKKTKLISRFGKSVVPLRLQQISACQLDFEPSLSLHIIIPISSDMDPYYCNTYIHYFKLEMVMN